MLEKTRSLDTMQRVSATLISIVDHQRVIVQQKVSEAGYFVLPKAKITSNAAQITQIPFQ